MVQTVKSLRVIPGEREILLEKPLALRRIFFSIKALIDSEDAKKVYSDQKLVDLLNAEGFDLARRTVAKYREAIGIGSSAQRRRAKKLQGL